jgi:hypothetical protein
MNKAADCSGDRLRLRREGCVDGRQQSTCSCFRRMRGVAVDRKTIQKVPSFRFSYRFIYYIIIMLEKLNIIISRNIHTSTYKHQL